MKTGLTCASLLLFVLAGPVFTQQDLVRLDDELNPCRRFKMIVLVPADSTSDKSARKPDDPVDPKMVWNPCPQSDVQFAAIPTSPAPKRGSNFVIPELGKPGFDSTEGVRRLPGPSPQLPKREP